MVFSRLSGVTAYSYYMVDIIKNTRVTIVSPEWASAGITIFEIVGKTNLPWTILFHEKIAFISKIFRENSIQCKKFSVKCVDFTEFFGGKGANFL